MRLDKYLAHCGLGSRKIVRQLIRQKRVTCNEEIVDNVGLAIDTANDIVQVDGLTYVYEQHIYLLMNKKAGVVSARSDALSPTIFVDLDPYYYKRGVFPVGRLDKDTTGLLLLTNDGQLAHQLLAPHKHVPKIYLVKLQSRLTQKACLQLQQGVQLADGYQCLPARVDVLAEKVIHLTINEGKFHQVKRMLHAVGNEVIELERIAMGPLQLDTQLARGESRILTAIELELLQTFKDTT